MDFNGSKIIDGVQVGFMSGLVGGFHKYWDMQGNEGVFYCDGVSLWLDLPPDKITFSAAKVFSTKAPYQVKGKTVTVSDNNLIIT